MSAAIISSRPQLVTNARAYERLVTHEVYRLPKDLKKTALETLTRTQAWIAIRDNNTAGEDVWFPVPQKWGGVLNVDIRSYEAHRRGGIDLQRIGQALNRLGHAEAHRNHDAWKAVRAYASDLGLELRDGATLWIIDGEELAFVERVTLDIVTDLVQVRNLSPEARAVLSNRLVA